MIRADASVLLFDQPSAMRDWSSEQCRAGLSVGLVATMGALHDGHMKLVECARSLSDLVVVSIFVNPLQFNSRSDFDTYPRPIDGDLQLCTSAGVDAVYAPTAATMYPAGFQTYVEPGPLAQPLEGANRPGHFRGVTTVVLKLLTAVRPQLAVFGQKDHQQLQIVRRMAIDLDLGVDIVGFETVRDPDGLAMSSRNRRLSPQQRSAAIAVPQALDALERAAGRGIRDVDKLQSIVSNAIATEPEARLEHIEIVDPDTLEPLVPTATRALAVIAVWFGDVRLIDNRVVELK